MLYPESVICNELRWEYGIPKWRALRVIERYKMKGEYERLCHLIERRKSISRKEC